MAGNAVVQGSALGNSFEADSNAPNMPIMSKQMNNSGVVSNVNANVFNVGRQRRHVVQRDRQHLADHPLQHQLEYSANSSGILRGKIRVPELGGGRAGHTPVSHLFCFASVS